MTTASLDLIEQELPAPPAPADPTSSAVRRRWTCRTGRCRSVGMLPGDATAAAVQADYYAHRAADHPDLYEPTDEQIAAHVAQGGRWTP